MKKLLYFIASITLVCASLFFVAIVTLIFSTEVLPAIRKGTLSVETSTMILNVLWEGNEIYIVLGAYTLLAICFAYGAIRIATKAIKPGDTRD